MIHCTHPNILYLKFKDYIIDNHSKYLIESYFKRLSNIVKVEYGVPKVSKDITKATSGSNLSLFADDASILYNEIYC